MRLDQEARARRGLRGPSGDDSGPGPGAPGSGPWKLCFGRGCLYRSRPTCPSIASLPASEWDPGPGPDPARPAAFPPREAASPRRAGGHSRGPFPAERRDPEGVRHRGLFRAGPLVGAVGVVRAVEAPASAVPACVPGPARPRAVPAAEPVRAALPVDAGRSEEVAAARARASAVRAVSQSWAAAAVAAAARARASGILSGEDRAEFRPTAAAVSRARSRPAAAPESRAARHGGAPDPEANRMSEAEMPAGPVRSARRAVAAVAARGPVRSTAPGPDAPGVRARPEVPPATWSPDR